MTTPALNDDLVRETEYVLLKRDLFECPRHQGYTGIRDKAGTWPLSYIQARDLPVKEAYDRSHEQYALPLSAAPEFTGACFDDLARDHLIKQRNAQAKEIEALRSALEPFAKYLGERKSDVAKGKPGILYERGANGHFCLPDGHGFQIVWADEDDGDVVEFTAGQFRRARTALTGALNHG